MGGELAAGAGAGQFTKVTSRSAAQMLDEADQLARLQGLVQDDEAGLMCELEKLWVGVPCDQHGGGRLSGDGANRSDCEDAVLLTAQPPVGQHHVDALG